MCQLDRSQHPKESQDPLAGEEFRPVFVDATTGELASHWAIRVYLLLLHVAPRFLAGGWGLRSRQDIIDVAESRFNLKWTGCLVTNMGVSSALGFGREQSAVR